MHLFEVTAMDETCKDHHVNLLENSEGYLSSQVAKETKCGSTKSPWRIEAVAGQQINITLIDFMSSDNSVPFA